MYKPIVSQISTYIKLTVLLAFLSGILVGLGFLIGGVDLAWSFLLISLILNFIMYFFSDKIVLATTGARIVSEQEAPRLHNIVEKVSNEAGIPKPKVGVINSPVPNAFATGRGPGNATVVATTGLLNMMHDDEIEAVIGHEIGHVVHRDTLIMTIVVAISTAISYIANMVFYSLFFFGFGGYGGGRDRDGSELALFAAALVAPIAATLIQLAISRSREYYADEASALITRKPLSLASALEKIESFVRGGYKMKVPPSTSALFIVNPFKGINVAELFSTHPSTENRIKRLRKLAEELQ
ncbi:MAG: M48 family metalloprotease [Thermoproteota archaeon]|nr:M48 family metalloprotease [Candidatus Brockarchaeota archaeon]MBO3767927.1 M48 family metalloprotease [Candidatus Brockarchaeota archaeon]MBO3800927.1 M48 family metalloprotease [Candidatus Brockarchaeota archaeon]